MTTTPAPEPHFLEAPELPPGVQRSERRPRWRPWTSWVALVAGFAGAVLGAIVIGAVAVAAGASFAKPPAAVNIAATVFQDVCLVASAVLFARMADRPRPGQFGLRPTRLWPALGWMVLAWIAFYIFTAIWVKALGISPNDDEVTKQLGVEDSTAAMVAGAALVTIVAPIAEEFFFRGYFFTALRNWKGLWPAAVITGLVFGAIHFSSSDPGFLAPLAFFGFVLCLIYARTGSLYPCIALHCANNAVAFGVSQGWTWQIAVLLGAALAVLALAALAVRRIWTPPAPAAPAPVAT